MTLVVLAAGIGSRYGGLKQIDPVGPSGEIVIDYSIFDARRAGFDRVVCVIRRDIERDFRACISARFEKQIAVDYVFQDLSDLPSGFALPPERRKPWGTGHAILACRNHIRNPFAVINADDFYGRQSYAALAQGLRNLSPGGPPHPFCMVGFVLRNTLSEHGSVARGVCTIDAQNRLQSVVERTHIEKQGNQARFLDDQKQFQPLSGDELVSLNMWGFTPALFPVLEDKFAYFLRERGGDPKAEYFIPTVVDEMIRAGQAVVQVAETPETWFGVTYQDDKPILMQGIRQRIEQGIYPQNLWG
jgi:dTDP-glucose pyrophosphorylase